MPAMCPAMKINLPVSGRALELPHDINILSTTDLKGLITYVNPELVETSGFSEEELLGQSHNIVRHPDMPPVAYAQLWKNLQSGRSWMGVVKNRCKNGDHYWVSAYVTPIIENGRIIEYQSVRTKPTEHWVAAAEQLYPQLFGQRMPRVLRRPRVSLFGRLLGLCAGALAVGFGCASLAFSFDPLAALLCAGLALALCAAGLWHSLTPWRQLLAEVRKIAINPVGQWIYSGRRDEFGAIAFALRMQAMEASAIVGRMGEAARQLAEHAARLQAAVERNALGTRQQQQETQQVASAIEQMSASIFEVANNALHSAEAAEQGDDAARAGERQVAATGRSIESLAQEVQRATEAVQRLQARGSQITAVIEVIEGIAGQTNLLALNAAIEAARAGDAGRGFAVVADEVRNLAVRTQDSTAQIQQMLGALQGEINAAVQTMHDSREQALHSEAQAAQATQALRGVHARVSAISDMSAQIASAVDQQSSASAAIQQAIEVIRQATGQSVQHGNDSHQAASEVSRQAGQLRLLARQFWQKRFS
jgi:aerotaxis receptor